MSTITFATYFGTPLGTTHTISSAIMGVRAVNGVRALRCRTIRQLVTAWILTFPICAAIGWAAVTPMTWLA